MVNHRGIGLSPRIFGINTTSTRSSVGWGGRQAGPGVEFIFSCYSEPQPYLDMGRVGGQAGDRVSWRLQDGEVSSSSYHCSALPTPAYNPSWEARNSSPCWLSLVPAYALQPALLLHQQLALLYSPPPPQDWVLSLLILVVRVQLMEFYRSRFKSPG